MPERILKEVPQVKIERRRFTNAFVETLAKWHRKTEIHNPENILKIKELLDQKIPVVGVFNHLGNLDGPLIPTEFKNISPELNRLFTAIMGEVVWRNYLTKPLLYAYDGILVPSARLKPEESDARGWAIRREWQKKADEETEKALKEGKFIGLAAEASRSRDKLMKQVSPKIARYFYLAENTHVVPIGLWNTEKVLPPDTKIFFVARFWNRPHLAVGEPISVAELGERVGASETKAENDQKIVDEVMYEIARLIPEEYQGYYKREVE